VQVTKINVKVALDWRCELLEPEDLRIKIERDVGDVARFSPKVDPKKPEVDPSAL
jgi:hypothetical protein